MEIQALYDAGKKALWKVPGEETISTKPESIMDIDQSQEYENDSNHFHDSGLVVNFS